MPSKTEGECVRGHRVLRVVARCLVGVAAILTSAAQAVPHLSIEFNDPDFAVTHTVSADLRITGVEDLYTYNLDLTYDPTVLGFQDVSTGGFLEIGGLTTARLFGGISFDAGESGRVQDVSNTLLGGMAGVSGTGTLATIDLTVLRDGPWDLRFSGLNEPAGTEFVDAAGAPIEVSAVAVPLPAPIALILPGLILAGLSTRHRRARRQARGATS